MQFELNAKVIAMINQLTKVQSGFADAFRNVVISITQKVAVTRYTVVSVVCAFSFPTKFVFTFCHTTHPVFRSFTS